MLSCCEGVFQISIFRLIELLFFLCEFFFCVNQCLSLVILVRSKSIVNNFLCLFIDVQPFHNIIRLAFAIEHNFFTILDNYTKEFSLNLEVVDTHPFIGVIILDLSFTVVAGIEPVELFNHQTNLFDKVHLRSDLPANVFGQLQQNLF